LAHHASAKKRMRQTLTRRARSRSSLAQVRTQIKKLRTAIAQGDAESARQLLPATVGGLDRASRKGVLHDNAAARVKSRLARKVNALPAVQS
jgi:small subunit ribosomal protein S20